MQTSIKIANRDLFLTHTVGACTRATVTDVAGNVIAKSDMYFGRGWASAARQEAVERAYRALAA